MIAVAIRYKDRIFYQELQSGQRFSVGAGVKDDVRVLDMVESQLVVSIQSNETILVQTKAPFQFSASNLPIGVVHQIDRVSGTSLFASRATGVFAKAVPLPYDGMLQVGRSDTNDVTIGLPFVSSKHFQVRVSGGTVRVEDMNSTNKLYLNGLQIKAAVMQPGDVLNILTVRIRRVNNTLQIENAGNLVKIAPASAAKPKAAPQTKPADKQLHFRLSPRIQDQLPQETIVLDRPPKKGQEYHPRPNRMGMMNMVIRAGASLAMGMVSPALAFFQGINVLTGVHDMMASSKMEKQRQAEMEEYNRRREAEYRTYIEAQRAQILLVAQEQRRILTEENPEPAKCLIKAEKLDRSLWERMPGDRDFLDVRLGMGYEDLCVPIKNYAESRGVMMEDDELEDLCNQIAEENRIVDYVPTRLPLGKLPSVGIVGPRERTIHLVRNMLVSLTTHHCHNDVQIVGIFDNHERARWGSVRWLPHIWDSSRQYRYLAFDRKRAHGICEVLYDILKRRREEAAGDFSRKKSTPTPHYVIILGSRELVQQEPLLELLSHNDPALGVTVLYLFDELYNLPQECGHFIDLTEQYPCTYSKQAGNQRQVFSMDTKVASGQFSKFARRLAAIELEDNRIENALPGSISFLEGMGARSVEDLKVLQRWVTNRVTDSLRVPIGLLATGKTFYLDNHYTAHGAHGLLAGTTGSGKSELLRTWILSMAVHYHPHQVCFVIIDYKGGGMANKLEALPHVVGKITNIDANITRSLVSLKREAKRRMELLEANRVDNIEDYMSLYYAGRITEPMPHLMIVSDEFAELKREEPEFLKELSSLARVGRSVGIHLMLATQRPAGVVDDQINSNTNFRICMKVSTALDSKEMIKRPDAAAITQRGRAYIRVGEDEMLELFQSFWSGAEYTDTQADTLCYSNQVSVVDISGERIGTTGKSKAENRDQLTAIVEHICHQAELARIPRLSGCWKPELPELLPLHSLEVPKGFDGKGWSKQPQWLRVPVGIYDRPALQEQGVQYIDFNIRPHFGIYGGPASGKTTMLKTLILSMGMQFSPADVNLYLLDFGGRSLGAFSGMPHVGMVIQDDEAEKLNKFLAWLQTEIRSRKLTFSKLGVSNFDSYRARKQDMPAIFVLVDNLQRLTTIHETVNDILVEISMTGSDAGVHLVYTANNINKVSMNLRANIGGNIALHLTDRNDYRTAVDVFPEGCREPMNPGRAVIRDSSAAEFQTAIFLQEQDEKKNNAALDLLLRQMASCWKGPAVAAVRTMPETVTAEQLESCYERRDVLPVGLDYENMEPVYLDLSGNKHCMLISSANESDGLKAMRSLAKLLLTKKDNKLYVLDPGGKLDVLEPRAAMYANNAADLNTLVKHLGNEVQMRLDALWEQQDDGKSFTPNSFSQICLLMESPHLIMKALDAANRKILLAICGQTDELGIIGIASGSVDDLSTYMNMEELTILLTDRPEDGSGENNQLGMCIGGVVKHHDWAVQRQLADTDRNLKIAAGDAVVIDRGKATRIKRIQ